MTISEEYVTRFDVSIIQYIGQAIKATIKARAIVAAIATHGSQLIVTNEISWDSGTIFVDIFLPGARIHALGSLILHVKNEIIQHLEVRFWPDDVIWESILVGVQRTLETILMTDIVVVRTMNENSNRPTEKEERPDQVLFSFDESR